VKDVRAKDARGPGVFPRKQSSNERISVLHAKVKQVRAKRARGGLGVSPRKEGSKEGISVLHSKVKEVRAKRARGGLGFPPGKKTQMKEYWFSWYIEFLDAVRLPSEPSFLDKSFATVRPFFPEGSPQAPRARSFEPSFAFVSVTSSAFHHEFLCA
jgi:hypothetical protein